MLNIFHDIPLCVPLGTNSRFAVVGSKLDASWNIMKNIQQVCGSVIVFHCQSCRGNMAMHQLLTYSVPCDYTMYYIAIMQGKYGNGSTINL